MSTTADRDATAGSSPFGVAIPLALGIGSLAVLAYASVSALGGLAAGVAAAISLASFLLLAKDTRGARNDDADPVTGLRGRAQLVRKLEERLGRADPPPTLVVLFDLHGFKAYDDNFGREAGDALLTRLARKLVSIAPPGAEVFRFPGDEFCLVAEVRQGEAEALIERAVDALSEASDAFRIGTSFGGVLVPYEVGEAEPALRLAEERLAGQRRSRQGVHTVTALVSALTARTGTAAATTRLESLAITIGGLLGMHGDRLEALARAAELHDVGTLSIPQQILTKPDELDKAEWEFVHRHPVVGEHLVRTSPELVGVASIVRAAHENWDGSGYPDCLAGDEIPIAARIIRVCHAFDAMLSPRPYRTSMTPEEALAEIEQGSGTAFDPKVVRVLSALVGARADSARAA